MIVAVARDNAIGIGGDQPFFIREDLRHFKQLTMGHAIIMGRKTFEALPKGALPGRRNIVVSRRDSLILPGAEVFGSLDEAVKAARAADSEPFVIGGGEIYRHSLNVATRLYVTEIDADVPGADTFFPAIDPSVWRLTSVSPWQLPAASADSAASNAANKDRKDIQTPSGCNSHPRFRFLIYDRV